LHESELPGGEARSRRDGENAAALAEIRVTPAEASLFNVLHFGLTVPPSDLCRRASFRDYSVGGTVTEEENLTALADCLSKGWLQVIDLAALLRIQDDVRRDGLFGPVYGYPPLGGVDFTHAGAEQWFRVLERLFARRAAKAFAYSNVVGAKSQHYYVSKSTAEVNADLWKSYEGVVSVAEPLPIGPWRANWWRRFPQGYRFDVEERMKWQSCISQGGAHCVFDHQALPADIAHTREVLRHLNVTIVEWLVFASMEIPIGGRNRIPGWVNESALERFGVHLTESECVDGLESCLRKGWVRQVDGQYISEIGDLLRADLTLMPIPFDPSKYRPELDFSPEGAQLYRMISAEIFGTAWEDSLYVEVTRFREEHRYCVTTEGLEAVRQEYVETGDHPQSVRTVPIGPWCVFWWRRFHSGFRMELTFGEL
jgi:hypothetical protein